MNNDYYNNIAKLPMEKFMDCLCDGNLQALLISGEVEEYVLAAAWHELQDQYAAALGNTEQRMYLRLLKEINIEAATLNQINSLIEVMQHYYCDYFGKHLNKLLGIDKKYTPENRPEFRKQLDHCITRTKGMEMKMEIKKVSLDALEKKFAANTGSKPTREFFSRMFNALEEFYQVPVTEQITTLRYCDRVNRMNNKAAKKR